MNQRQNQSNKSYNQTQYKSSQIYIGSSSPKNIHSSSNNQKNSAQYSKINNGILKNGEVIHRSTRKNFDEDGNTIITTKIVREMNQGNFGNNINSRSMIDSRHGNGNINYRINNEQGKKYNQYSKYSNNENEENQEVIYGNNYGMFSPSSYKTQIKATEKYEKYSNGFGNGNNGQRISENEKLQYYNYSNIESPDNFSDNSPSYDFNSPDRPNEYNTKYFKNIQIEKIKGKSPLYNEKMNIKNNQIESSIKYGYDEYNNFQDREDELLDMIDSMATLIQANVRGFLVRKKVIRYITLAIYYQSFCDKLQDVLCIHIKREVFNILKNLIKSSKNKYGTKEQEINISNNNYRKNNFDRNQMHTSKSYYKTFKTERNHNYKNGNKGKMSNNHYNITENNYKEYNINKNTPIKNLKKNTSFQSHVINGYKKTYNIYRKNYNEKTKSPSSKVIHYFINSPCSKKTSHNRYFYQINSETTNIKSHGDNQLNNHRVCHKCDEISKMKKQEKYYITANVEKTEDEGYMKEYETNTTYMEQENHEHQENPLEVHEYEENTEDKTYEQMNHEIPTVKKNIESDNYLSVNYIKLPEKTKNITKRDIYTSTITDPNKISKVESINIKTNKKQKTEEEIDEEINRRVKMTVIEKEKIWKEEEAKREKERKEKERIEYEKKEKERKELEEKRKKEEQIRIEKEKERQRKEEQIRIEKEKERQRKEEQMRIEKQKREEQLQREREEKRKKEEQARIEKEKERQRKEEQMRIEREKERQRKEEQMRIELQKKEELIRIEREKEKQRKEELLRIQKETERLLKEEKMKLEKERERLKKEEQKINMGDYISKKDCQKNLEEMRAKLEKEYEKRIEMEKKRGIEEQKKYEEKIEIRNKKEMEKIMEQQKKKELERKKE